MSVNRMKKRILLLLLVIPALIKAQDVMTETRQELTSPDGAYRFTFYQRAVGEDNTQMYYTLTYKNRPVIEESKLGVLIENQLFESALGIPNDTCHFWCENLKLTGTEHQKTDEIWKPVYGERAEVRDCYNEMTLKFKKGEGKGNQDGGYDKRKNYFMNIIVRAYNEGVAFRYHFLEMTNGLFLHIVGEQTSFTMPEGTMAYYERWAQGPYELRPLKGWGKEESERPLTLKLPDGLSVALLEAEMVDYVRGKFRLSAEKPSTLETSLYSSVDIISPYSTPWRVIMVGERPVDLINNNDIVLNLNPACKLADTSWVKPGKVFRSGDLKQDRVKAAIDFAAERGIQYVHMDAGWYGPEMKMSSDATTVSPDKDLDIPALCKYAESKGIGLMVYVNQRALVQQLDTLLPLYKKWGLKGIKFGFVQIGNQRWSTWLHDAVRKCGEYDLMVDIHDEYRPTGFSRTYPNLIGNESARGTEYESFGGNNVNHTTILPFTRLIGGPMDYTPGIFETHCNKMNPTNNSQVRSTLARQLALYVTMYSPLQMAADIPENYERFMDAFQFIKDVAIDWDETKYLEAEPGDYITIARRAKGTNDWYIGCTADENGHTSKLTFDFLEPGKQYIATVYADAKDADWKDNPQAYTIRKGIVTGKSKLNLRAASGGGYAISIKEVKDKSEVKGIKRL